MSNQNILIIEDEENLGETLFEYLQDKGFHCRLAKNCEETREHFLDPSFLPSVLLMDIGLPDGNGIELAQELRQIRKNFVLLFLSALNDPQTRFEGLQMGAEDYITKPFDLRELMIRLEKALLTHKDFESYASEIKLGMLQVSFEKYEIMDAHGTVIALNQKECAILELLYKKKNLVVSRDEIIQKIWGEDAFPSNRTVDNYIVKLRKWIETDQNAIIEIKSIRSVGYQLIEKL